MMMRMMKVAMMMMRMMRIVMVMMMCFSSFFLNKPV